MLFVIELKLELFPKKTQKQYLEKKIVILHSDKRVEYDSHKIQSSESVGTQSKEEPALWFLNKNSFHRAKIIYNCGEGLDINNKKMKEL